MSSLHLQIPDSTLETVVSLHQAQALLESFFAFELLVMVAEEVVDVDSQLVDDILVGLHDFRRGLFEHRVDTEHLEVIIPNLFLIPL